MTTTTIILQSDDPAPVLVESLTVRFFSTVGVFVTSGVSNPNGEVVVDLPDADYDLMFFKEGVSINSGMPQRITVDAADPDVPPNTYRVTCHVASLPESVDPRLCMVSGNVIGPSGEPSRDMNITFVPDPESGVIGTSVLSPKSQITQQPDLGGGFLFELLRNVTYCAYLAKIESFLGGEPPVLGIKVPDAPAIDIGKLLFPTLVTADFSANTLALVAGDPDDESITVVLTYSDGNVKELPPVFLTVSAVSDNTDVCEVGMLNGKLVVSPIAAGVANVTIEQILSEDLYYVPLPTFTSETVVVTVT